MRKKEKRCMCIVFNETNSPCFPYTYLNYIYCCSFFSFFFLKKGLHFRSLGSNHIFQCNLFHIQVKSDSWTMHINHLPVDVSRMFQQQALHGWSWLTSVCLCVCRGEKRGYRWTLVLSVSVLKCTKCRVAFLIYSHVKAISLVKSENDTPHLSSTCVWRQESSSYFRKVWNFS